MDNFFTIGEAADKLGLAPKTLRRWEDADKFTPQRTMGGQRRYSIEDIQILDAIKNDIIPSQSDLLTVEQAANLFGVTPQTIVRWDNEGKIHSLITSSNTYYSKSNLSTKIQQIKTPEPAHERAEHPFNNRPIEVSLNPQIATPKHTYHQPHQPNYSPSPQHTVSPTTQPSPQQTYEPPKPQSTTTQKPQKPLIHYFIPTLVINLLLTISLLLGYHALTAPNTSTQEGSGDVKGVTSLSTAIEEILNSMVDISGNLTVPGDIIAKNSLNLTGSLAFSPSTEPDPIPGTIYYDRATGTLRFYSNNKWLDLGSTNFSLNGTQAEIGTATISKNASTSRVNNESLTSSSIVSVTFNSDYAPAKKYWVTSSNGYFTLTTDFPVGQDTDYTYIIVSADSPESSDIDPQEDTSADSSTRSLDIDEALLR